MRKFSRGAMAATVGSMLFLTATATAAHAVDFVSDSINGLSSKTVYVDSSVSLNNSGIITGAFSQHSVGVAVLPEMATSTFSANTLADQILEGTDGQFETVIVAIDGRSDSFGVASNGDEVQIATSLNKNNAGDAGEALTKSAEVIVNATAQSQNGTSTEVSESGDSGMSLSTFAAPSLIILVVIGVVIAVNTVKRRPKNTARPIMDQNLAALPEDLRKVTEKFRSIYSQHKSRGNDELADRLGSIITNLQELFSRIARKGTEQQQRLASVQYLDTLTKLNNALGEDYYLDIQDHPELWNNSSKRLLEVKQAVDATSTELVTNIRNFNESKDLEFKVALESLSRSVNDTSVDQFYDKDLNQD